MAHLRLGELLLQAGALSRENLDFALQQQQRSKLRLGQILVDYHLISEAEMVDALARVTGLSRLDIATITVDAARMRSLMDPWTAERENVVPLHADDGKRSLIVAVSDPTNVTPLDDLSFRSGLKVQAVLGTAAEIEHLINHVFHAMNLDRDFSARVRQPGGHLQPGEIMHSIAEEPSIPPPPRVPAAPLAAPITSPIRSEPSLSELFGPLLMIQEKLALELQVAFELLVEKGWITQEAYIERLTRRHRDPQS